MSTFAPLQFLKSAQNQLVWTAIDNGTDTRTSLIIYYGAVNTLPADTDMYEVNCIMMHQAEKQLYANTGTSSTPSWEAFGPNSAFPQPLVPGSFLFTDGATVYWATQLVGQVQYNATNLNQYGILNFNSLLVASNDVPNSRINVDLDVVALGGDATFISTLEGNLDLANIGGSLDWTQIDQNSVSVDLATQVTGVLNSTNIDITNLESNLDLSSIAGSLDLTTQVTGLLPATNIDVSDLATDATFLAALIPELDENVKVAVDGVTITGDGTTGNPLVATGSGGAGISEQNLGGIGPSYNSGPTDTELTAITAETDGSVIYASFREDSDNPVIVRYERDSNTGFYKKTHIQEYSVTGTGRSSLAVIGSYLYVYTTAAANAVDIKRVLSADLSGSTSMTETPSVTGGDDGAMFTDGTDLFINVNTAVGTWKQYSISGTALTYVQDITSGMTGVTNAFYIGGLVYMLDSTDITNTINAYSYTTTFSLVASDTFGMGNMGQESSNPDSTLRGIVPIGATTFYVGFAAVFRGYFGSTGSTSECQNLVIKPFTIPV